MSRSDNSREEEIRVAKEQPRDEIRTACPCDCHGVCSCDLGLSLGAWCCRRHEGAHCRECAGTPLVKEAR